MPECPLASPPARPGQLIAVWKAKVHRYILLRNAQWNGHAMQGGPSLSATLSECSLQTAACHLNMYPKLQRAPSIAQHDTQTASR